jgi:Glycosyl transferase family 2
MRADLLTVVTAYSNPIQFESRRALYLQFAAHMKASGVRLITVEAALGERAFEVTTPDNPDHLQVRTSSVLWTKENLLGLGFRRAKTEYLAWIDADVTFRDPEWAARTVDALQHYKIVQPWSDCYELGPRGEHLNHWRAFCRQHYYRQPWQTSHKGPYDYWHCGFAWAARREVLQRVGGLIDFAILGAADHHMALSLIGKGIDSVHGKMQTHPAHDKHSPYLRHVLAWEKRAQHHVNDSIGFVLGTIEHGWHGRKADRKYWDRWQILIDEQFDPEYDIKRNLDGVIELDGNKPELTHKIDRYFRNRMEDANSTR